ncbi:MAG: hypothetical protein Kow0077_32300 [Anaerolineae bacterium]
MRKWISLVMSVALLAVGVPLAGAQMTDAWRVELAATPFAAGAGLDGVTGYAHIQPGDGIVHIVLEPNGATLPEGAVLEGWLVDAGRNGGPGTTNATTDDQVYGPPFGEPAFDVLVSAAPYALSTGVLTPEDMGNWEVTFQVPAYNFSPYDAVVITLESDGNSPDGFDPRPGTPVFAGGIADAAPADMMDTMGMAGMDMMEMGMGVEVTLATTPLAANAGLETLGGTAVVYSDTATIEITLDLMGGALPEGTVLEGWLVDAGRFGGPGVANVSDADEAFGTPFGDASFDAAVEAAPYALSTGVVTADDMGALHLTFHVHGYNFSPYDAVVITLESDGNSADGFDPRPGTPVLVGAIDGM